MGSYAVVSKLTLHWRREFITRGRVSYSLWARDQQRGEFRVCTYELPPEFPISNVCRLVKRDASIIGELVELHAATVGRAR